MCPRRFYPVYNIDILWSCCSIINPPLWLQSHTGEVLHLHASVLSLVLMRFTVFFSLYREYLSTVLIKKHSKQLWMRYCNLYACWHRINMEIMLSRFSAAFQFFELALLFTIMNSYRYFYLGFLYCNKYLQYLWHTTIIMYVLFCFCFEILFEKLVLEKACISVSIGNLTYIPF